MNASDLHGARPLMQRVRQQGGTTLNIETEELIFRKRAFFWVAIGTVVILIIPFSAMQFTDEVNWGIADFIVMSFLLFGMGSLFVLISRRAHRKQRVLIGAIIATLVLFTWAELAVGVFTGLGS